MLLNVLVQSACWFIGFSQLDAYMYLYESIAIACMNLKAHMQYMPQEFIYHKHFVQYCHILDNSIGPKDSYGRPPWLVQR